MKICIPVNEDKGLDSQVCEHFGSAPLFMIVDKDSGDCEAIQNGSQHHGHGMCRPVETLEGHDIDVIIVGGIGMGALAKLSAGGIDAFLSTGGTVREAVDAFKAGKLQHITRQNACARHGHGHSHGHGPSHGHGHGSGHGHGCGSGGHRHGGI